MESQLLLLNMMDELLLPLMDKAPLLYSILHLYTQCVPSSEIE